MNEGTKKNIYYELKINNVSVKPNGRCTYYTFGNYRIHSYNDHLYIGKLNPENGAFVEIPDTSCNDEFPKNSAYAIFIAAKNKHEGKEYFDPYKNIPVNEVINDSIQRFKVMFTEHATDVFPYDMPKQQQEKIITEMETILAQKIRRYKTEVK